MFNTPILFLIFNRPDLAEIVFKRVREVKPAHLFIAADGPRKGFPEDREKCDKSRIIVLNMIDWDCQIHTLFQQENLGCANAVSNAITWFFNNVEEGIILEDDCLPDISFFYYCKELLSYYHNNLRIMHIGGISWKKKSKHKSQSYYFSIYPYVWGWATWRESWKYFNPKIENDISSISNVVSKYVNRKREKKYWNDIFLKMSKYQNDDIWDYLWHYSIWSNGGISILPEKNLVTNIGFGLESTHTREPVPGYKNVIQIETAPLDEILQNQTRVDAIRMDIEGGEYEVIYGMMETIKHHHPLLFIELHASLKRKLFLSELHSLGYECLYSIERGKNTSLFHGIISDTRDIVKQNIAEILQAEDNDKVYLVVLIYQSHVII